MAAVGRQLEFAGQPSSIALCGPLLPCKQHPSTMHPCQPHTAACISRCALTGLLGRFHSPQPGPFSHFGLAILGGSQSPSSSSSQSSGFLASAGVCMQGWAGDQSGTRAQLVQQRTYCMPQPPAATALASMCADKGRTAACGHPPGSSISAGSSSSQPSGFLASSSGISLQGEGGWVR